MVAWRVEELGPAWLARGAEDSDTDVRKNAVKYSNIQEAVG
jgi:hypothetical protein